jgi:hypothetical protein
VSDAEPLIDFVSLRVLFRWAHGGDDAALGEHRFVRGELQGRCRDGRFVLSTQHVDGYDTVAGLLECEAATLPANLELRDHLIVDIDVLEYATRIESARLSRLIDERLRSEKVASGRSTPTSPM